MLIVSFYTDDFYRTLGMRLKTSCRRLGLECVVKRQVDLLDWRRNCKQKANFLLRMLRLFPGEDSIAWVDCDAEVREIPVLLIEGDHREVPFDVAARVDRSIVYGGTLFFKNNRPSRMCLANWIAENSKENGFDDRPGFAAALARTKGMTFAPLPAEYDWCRRFDMGKPIIEQHMCSRLTDRQKELLVRASSL